MYELKFKKKTIRQVKSVLEQHVNYTCFLDFKFHEFFRVL